MDCSSYANVFIPGEPQPLWPKLQTCPWLSELHAKFWGKNIHQDELGWQHSLRQADQLKESTVLPGSFVLNIGTNHITSSNTWIRRDYLQLYDHCDKHCKRVIKNGSRPPSVVITGHPGIGECILLDISFQTPFYERKKPLGPLCNSSTPR